MYEKPIVTSDIYPQLSNLKTLFFVSISLSHVFPGPDTIENSIIPASLQNLALGWVTVDNDDWSVLSTFLAHRASAGNPLSTLKIHCGPHMCSQMVERIRGMVKVFEISNTKTLCPSGFC